MSEPSRSDPHAPSQPRRLSRLSLGQLALIFGCILLVWVLGSVLLLVFLAVLLAVSLRGAADVVAAHGHIPVHWALAAVVVAICAALAGLAYWTGPNLYGQLNDLVGRLLNVAEQIRRHLDDSGVLQGGARPLQTLAERAVSPLATVFTVSLTTATEVFAAVVTAIYFAAAPSVYVGGAIRLAPMRYRARLRHVFEALAHILRRWVLGQLFNMVAIGLLASVGLSIAGVPAPIALGVISGVFTFVPYVGTITSGAIATAIALSAGLGTAVAALVVFTVCHLVEGYVIAPLVQRRILELPPALSILSMTVLGSLFGLPGIILGTPFAAALLVLVQSLYVGDVLGDHDMDPTKGPTPEVP